MKPISILITLLCSVFVLNAQKTDEDLVKTLKEAATSQLLDKWYPLVIDKEDGGYYSDITYDFKLGENQQKMIVTQARHMWVNAIAAMENPGKKETYLENAKHGFDFIKNKMWDQENGGFHTLVTKQGEPISREGEKKTAYGNSFAIYGLATYYKASQNSEALTLAQETFYWLERHSHDPKHKGYFQSLELDGTPIARTSDFPSTSDIGYKDQNSSIHLLEAFTALYEVWPNELLKKRLHELLVLIRDTITTDDGYMKLFFEADWTPVSFKNTSKENIKKHYYLEHVSFGHDVETAYLMLEASHALGLENDITLKTGKKMVDHALKNGFDNKVGGFYDGGYYFNDEQDIQIVNENKNWWSQAEGLNALLMMSQHFPQDEMNYRKHFETLWEYTENYIIDQDHGGWYEWGIDKRPEAKTALKGQIWKSTYHNYRALVNCIHMLEE
ncbi:AGE family epimerase/isomerase [Galbibacter sp. EGI 63066]|uniref:AGE family epimerase/isomerase n=1 Tax=Galbibacter sp. EGI 63066 TaxID=2993559 RepID=UPI002248BC44|nr:AGE family epimerase/isomerase [Galbibacter sp. EGI 63066]MCX2681177.1 AGE family epimerase/isomerase [Galbibacter sp. EGI 63066]